MKNLFNLSSSHIESDRKEERKNIYLYICVCVVVVERIDREYVFGLN